MPSAHPFPLTSRKSSFFIIALSSLTLALFALLSLLMTAAHAAQVTVAWDANADPAVTGYRVHYGTAPGNYTSHVDVGNVTTCVISGLLEGVTYYFAATAYDGDGHESDYSAAVSYTVPQAPAPGPAPSPAGNSPVTFSDCPSSLRRMRTGELVRVSIPNATASGVNQPRIVFENSCDASLTA